MNISKSVAFSDNVLFLDEEFPKRVLKTSLILSVILSLFSTSLGSVEITCGLTFGMALSFGLMRLLWWLTSAMLPELVKNKRKKITFPLIFFNLVKYVLISGALFYILRYVPVNLIAFLIGVSFVQLVMVSKILSIMLVNYTNKSIKVNSEKQTGLSIQQHFFVPQRYEITQSKF